VLEAGTGTGFSLAADLLQNQAPAAGAKVRRGAKITVQFGHHRQKKLRSRIGESGIRMKIGLSPEDQVQDAATSQFDSQRKQSVRSGLTDSGRKLSEVLQGVETTLPARAGSLEIRQVAW